MSKLVDFYTKVVKSLGLDVNSNGVISVDGTDVLIEGKPLVIPNEESIKTLVAKNDDGTLSITKVLFNPLSENALKAEGPGITKMMYVSRIMLSSSFLAAGKLLLILAKNKEQQSSTPMFINEFLGKLGKEPIDDKSIENWEKICDKAGPMSVDIKNKKLGAIGTEKFIRLASLTYSVYDELKNNTEHIVHGVKIRARDKEVFRAVCELLIPGIEEVAADNKSHILYYGTNDKISPSFVSIFGLINKVGTIVTKVKSHLLKLDITLDTDIIDWKLTNDEIILAPTNFKVEVETIPNDMDIITSINKEVVKENNPIANIINKPQAQLSTVVNPDTVGIGNGYLSLTRNNQPQQAAGTTQVVEELSAIDKILGRRTTSVQTADVFSPFAQTTQLQLHSTAPVSASDLLLQPRTTGIGLIGNTGMLGGGYIQQQNTYNNVPFGYNNFKI